jgi:Eukaryotic aspartyl protease
MLLLIVTLLSALSAALPNAEAIADPQFSANTLHLERAPLSELTPALQKRASSGKLFSVDGGNSFLTNIEFGSQTFKVVVDTGSSDTWLIGTGYTCLDSQGNKVPENTCDFAKAYAYKQDTTLSQDSTEAGENFELRYGDGEYLTGFLATDKVTLAGVSFQTEVGICTQGYWNGDGQSSGLVGLAFPVLTSAYYGTNPSKDGPDNKAQYNSIMYQLFETNGYTPAMFSMALSRDNAGTGYGGSLTIGGVPNLSDPRVNAKANYAYANFEITPSISKMYYSYYTITVDTVTFGSGNKKQSDSKQRLYTIDSGTSLIYLPSILAKAYNSLWSQPATFHPKTGEYYVPCDATVPPFSVTISRQVFTINPRDLLQHNSDGTCLSTVLDVLDGDTLVLGDIFLKNVLAVFDWNNQRMG